MFGVLTRRVATRSATALLGGEGSIATARYFASKSRPPSKGATPTKKPDQPPAPTEATAEAEASPPAPLSTTPQSLSLDFSPLDQADGTERTGARSSKDLPSSAEEERKAMGRLLLGLLAVGLGGNLFYFGREWSEEDKQRLQSEGVPDSRWGRISRRYQDVFDVRVPFILIHYEYTNVKTISISASPHGPNYYHPSIHHLILSPILCSCL